MSTKAQDNLNQRPATITAAQWGTIADDVKAGRVKAYLDGVAGNIIDIDATKGGYAFYCCMENPHDVAMASTVTPITLEWQDAPESDAAPDTANLVPSQSLEPNEVNLAELIKQGNKILAIQMYRRMHEGVGLWEANGVINKMLAARLTYEQLEAENKLLQAELDALKKTRDVNADIEALLIQQRVIDAIKLWRNAFNVDLVTAKTEVEKLNMWLTLEKYVQEGKSTKQIIDQTRAELDAANRRADALHDTVSRALWLLGVDPSDWTTGVYGIEAAVKSNLQIGSDELKSREDWCDDDWNLEGTITERLFSLTERAAKAEAQAGKLREALKFYADINHYVEEKVGTADDGRDVYLSSIRNDEGSIACKALDESEVRP